MKVKLGDVCDVFSGFAFKSFNEIQKGNPVIKIGNIQANGKISYESCVYSEENPDKKYYSKVNDIYIALSGATTGKVGIMDKSGFLINQRVGVVRLKDKKIPVKYLYSFLQSKSIKILRDAFGAAQPNISPRDILNYEINVGQNYEMEEIANRLDKINELIEKRKCQLEKLDFLIKSKFKEMFGQVKKEDALINLCQFIDYRGKTPEKADEGLPFITAKNIKMHYMSFDTQEFISKDNYYKVMTRGFPKEGDVVFTTEAPMGNVCRIPHIETEFYIGQRIITMQTTILEPAYLEYALSSESFREKISEKSSGSTVTGIRSKLLEKLTIPVPDREQQKRFARFVEQTDKSKLTIKQSLEKLETLKKALMQKYFG